MIFNQNLLSYIKAEENLLRAKLDAIRAAIPPRNRSEKGRSVELAVYRFFRDILPSEYGLTTGFIAYHSNDCIEENARLVGDSKHYLYRYRPDRDSIQVSSQLDLIIYDAIRFSPIMKLEGCDVLPFEAVFAYVEIKSWIDNTKDNGGLTDLQKLLKQSKSLRDIKARLYWLSQPGKYTKTILMPYPLEEAISIRSLVFILDTDEALADYGRIKALLEEPEAKAIKGFLSSMYIQDKGYFRSYHAESEPDERIGTIEGAADNALALFKVALYASLSRFPRAESSWTPAIDRYYYNEPVQSAEVELIKKPGEISRVLIKMPQTIS